MRDPRAMMNALEHSAPSEQSLLQSARRTFDIEVAALQALGARLDGSFARACQLCLQCLGRRAAADTHGR